MGVPQAEPVRVADGVVGVYEYGDPAGVPVMALHGTPACGAGFAFADEPARSRGIRVIAPDRPGVGISSRGRWTVASYPAQLAAVAASLDIDRYAVWGYSGGGPYAAACAAVRDSGVTRVAICAGMGQIGEWADVGDFEKTDRQMLEMARRRPRVARLAMAVTGRLARLSPATAVKSFEKELVPSDREVLRSLGPPAEAMALFTEAVRHGAAGVVDDYRVLGLPWEIDLDTVAVPVRAFHGDADATVPLAHSQALVARVSGADLVTWAGDGHLGTISHVGEILDWLVAV